MLGCRQKQDAWATVGLFQQHHNQSKAAAVADHEVLVSNTMMVCACPSPVWQLSLRGRSKFIFAHSYKRRYLRLTAEYATVGRDLNWNPVPFLMLQEGASKPVGRWGRRLTWPGSYPGKLIIRLEAGPI